MANLLIKPTTGPGNKLILQDQEGGDAIEIADTGTTLTAPTLAGNATASGNLTVSGDLIPSTPLSNRNMIINGAMQVSQRDTLTGTSGGYGGPDRYTNFINNAGTWEQSQSTESPAGFSNSYKMKCTVANASLGAGNYVILGQRLEAQNLQHLQWGTSSAKDITLSFWVRSAKTGIHVVQLFHDEATGYNSIAYTINVVNTWEYKTMTFSGHPSIAIDNNNDSGFRMYFWLDAGSNYDSGTLTNNTWHTTLANRAAGQVTLADTVNNEFYITGVQLELGSNATPFEHRSYGDELARCQRYFIRYGDGTNAIGIGAGSVYGTTANIMYIFTPVTMRARPTAAKFLNGSSLWLNTYVGASGLQANPGIELGEVAESSNVFRIYNTSAVSGKTAGQATWAIILAGASMTLSAEL